MDHFCKNLFLQVKFSVSQIFSRKHLQAFSCVKENENGLFVLYICIKNTDEEKFIHYIKLNKQLMKPPKLCMCVSFLQLTDNDQEKK